jgi:drug/metabolite transporter (DMT)-like permease
MVQRLGSMRLVGLATSVACVLCIVQFVIFRSLDVALAVAPQVIWLSLLNATLCTVVPVMMVMMAIERIGSGLAAQVGMVGPMSTILMGALVLGDPALAPTASLGGVRIDQDLDLDHHGWMKGLVAWDLFGVPDMKRA